MNSQGGRNQHNPAGAACGSGYCDAQCDVGSWFNGTAKTYHLGAFCNEMDLWEANSEATAIIPHTGDVVTILPFPPLGIIVHTPLISLPLLNYQ